MGQSPRCAPSILASVAFGAVFEKGWTHMLFSCSNEREGRGLIIEEEPEEEGGGEDGEGGGGEVLISLSFCALMCLENIGINYHKQGKIYKCTTFRASFVYPPACLVYFMLSTDFLSHRCLI